MKRIFDFLYGTDKFQIEFDVPIDVAVTNLQSKVSGSVLSLLNGRAGEQPHGETATIHTNGWELFQTVPDRLIFNLWQQDGAIRRFSASSTRTGFSGILVHLFCLTDRVAQHDSIRQSFRSLVRSFFGRIVSRRRHRHSEHRQMVRQE